MLFFNRYAQLLVGAPFHSIDVAESGQVYVYQRSSEVSYTFNPLEEASEKDHSVIECEMLFTLSSGFPCILDVLVMSLAGEL